MKLPAGRDDSRRASLSEKEYIKKDMKQTELHVYNI